MRQQGTGGGESRPRGGRDERAIVVENLMKVYDGPEGEIRAVDDVSFTVDSGTVVGVLGPNGAGKTTMLKSMLGLVIPTSGTVHLGGVDVHANPSKTYRRTGAMLEGARNIYWRLTVRENLEFFSSLVGHRPGDVRERHDELLDTFDLGEKADETVKDLSRGMKQKVSLASTLSRAASILFLDEPTLGLDVESSLELRRELRALVERESITVVLSSHDMDVIEALCDRVIIMNDGHVVADDTVENLTGVFDSQAYEVTMDGQIPAELRSSIEREYAVENWEQLPAGRETFEVVFEDGFSLYDLVGRLEESGTAVASLDTIQPDLESVFIELTNDSANGEYEAATGEDGSQTPEPRSDGGEPNDARRSSSEPGSNEDSRKERVTTGTHKKEDS